jgi:hypothetical protein
MNILEAVIYVSILYGILPFIDELIDNIGLLITWVVKNVVRFTIYYIMCLMYVLWFIMVCGFVLKFVDSFSNGTKLNFNNSDYIFMEQDVLMKYLHVDIYKNHTYL